MCTANSIWANRYKQDGVSDCQFPQKYRLHAADSSWPWWWEVHPVVHLLPSSSLTIWFGLIPRPISMAWKRDYAPPSHRAHVVCLLPSPSHSSGFDFTVRTRLHILQTTFLVTFWSFVSPPLRTSTYIPMYNLHVCVTYEAYECIYVTDTARVWHSSWELKSLSLVCLLRCMYQHPPVYIKTEKYVIIMEHTIIHVRHKRLIYILL